MLEWLVGEPMRVEAEGKVWAEKQKHSDERVTYFSSYRVRKLNSRVRAMYLQVAEVRKNGYIPFFCDREETQRGSIAEFGAGGVSK